MEDTSAVPVGAPIRVSVNNGAIIVLRTTNTNAAVSTGKFSYNMDGTYYNWIERPFIGVGVGWYYITISLIFIALLLVAIPLVIFVIYVLCPLIPISQCFCLGGLIYYCCRGKKGKPAKGRRRGSRYGNSRGSPRGGVALNFSPPGGKARGAPPKLTS